MDELQWDHRPQLRSPVLVAAFEGWGDAGESATTAARYLASSWSARTVAHIDPELYYDFSATRPHVRLVDGLTRHIDWPANELSVASPPGLDHDVVFLVGIEPQLRWRTFSGLIIEAARTLGVEMVLSLGALLADVPHTQDVRVTGTAADARLVASLGLQRSRYEGPTGIVGVLHDAFGAEGIPSASLWAAVPHYVSQTPSPKAALALVGRAAAVLGASLETVDLQIASAAYERQVTELVEGDDDVADYVRRLEQAYADDDELEVEVDDNPPIHLASGVELAAEAERFLREHGDN